MAKLNPRLVEEGRAKQAKKLAKNKKKESPMKKRRRRLGVVLVSPSGSKYFPISGRKISPSPDPESEHEESDDEEDESDIGTSDESDQEEEEEGNELTTDEQSSNSDSEQEDEEDERDVSEIDEEQEQEEAADYQKGGYHPVTLKEKYNNRYKIIRKMGWGHFSTVWLCLDKNKKGTHEEYVALKILRSKEDRKSSSREMTLLTKVYSADIGNSSRNKIVRLLDNFIITGRHGKHVCMVMEAVGPNLVKLIDSSKLSGISIPIQNVRSILHQVLEGLCYLHSSAGIIHTDLKPENVLIQCDHADFKYLHDEVKHWDRTGTEYPPSTVCNLPKNLKAPPPDNERPSTSSPSSLSPPTPPTKPNPAREVCQFVVKIADLGNAMHKDNLHTTHIQTRQYRSVEALLGIKFNTTTDIWSVACMGFELATSDYLFDPRSSRTNAYTRDDHHLVLIQKMLGKIPKKMALQGKFWKDFYEKNGKMKYIRKLEPLRRMEDLLQEKYSWGEEEAEEFASFLVPMLNYNVDKRVNAEQCLRHEWIQGMRGSGGDCGGGGSAGVEDMDVDTDDKE